MIRTPDSYDGVLVIFPVSDGIAAGPAANFVTRERSYSSTGMLK